MSTTSDYRQGRRHEGIVPLGDLEAFGWTVISGTPAHAGRFDHGSLDTGPLVGIWSCTPGVIEMAAQPYNEFVTLFDGEVIATLDDGEPVALRAGDCFFVPKGSKIRWDIRRTVFKYLLACATGPLVT